MHRRHLHYLDGKIEPTSGLVVRAYGTPINFEWQVEQHMKMWRSELERRPEWNADAKAKERAIKLALATGQAWLHAEPQMWLFDATRTEAKGG